MNQMNQMKHIKQIEFLDTITTPLALIVLIQTTIVGASFITGRNIATSLTYLLTFVSALSMIIILRKTLLIMARRRIKKHMKQAAETMQSSMKNNFQSRHSSHERTNKFIPQGIDELNTIICHTPHEDLIKMGCLQVRRSKNGSVLNWHSDDTDKTSSELLYALPKEWYNYLPEGAEFIRLDGTPLLFQKGITPNESIGGCLTFGFIRSNTKTDA